MVPVLILYTIIIFFISDIASAEGWLGTPHNTRNYQHYQTATMVGMGKYLTNISILLVHGTEDHLVDLHHSMMLAKVANRNDNYACIMLNILGAD